MPTGNDERQFVLIYPESHQHLGLFADLENLPNVQLIVATRKKIKSPFIKIIRKLHSSCSNKICMIPFGNYWYKLITLSFDNTKSYCIIIVDGAMKAFSATYLNNIFRQKNVRGVLVLLNAMDAKSVMMLEIKRNITNIKWDAIYSFDSGDVQKYGYQSLGNCYYSSHDINLIKKKWSTSTKDKTDAYFTGGLKGGRERVILSVFKKIYTAGLYTNFNIMVSGKYILKKKLYSDIINYYSGGWFPYEKVIAGILNSNVVIEILQVGQTGPSLRYYEAVCYNKKLLTNNPEIKNLPYYDSRYMKVFKSVEDIDVEWVKKSENIDYHYADEFSPIHLLDVVLK